MRVRLLELRLVAGLLVALWAGGAIAVLVGYRPGGPVDLLVAAAALLPVAIAAAALIWPPLARGPRASAGIGWLGVITALLLIPALAGIVGNLAAGGRQTLLPSPEVAYAALLPLALTCLFSGLGIARAVLGQTSLRRRRLVLGGGLALVLTVVSATAFGGAALANELALRQQPPPGGSPLGPTDPSLVPPDCDGRLLAGPSSQVTLTAAGRIDGSDYGELRLSGERDGQDGSWQAARATPWSSGSVAYTRLGSMAWRREDGGDWRPAPVRSTLDQAVVEAALHEGARIASEDVGLDRIEGATARHCRLAIGGPTALDAMPALRWLVGGDVLDDDRALDAWRGEIDWWVFADDQLGMATLTVSGPPASDWPRTGFQATLSAELIARERAVRHPVVQPVDGGEG
jgi:hypothetical protein